MSAVSAESIPLSTIDKEASPHRDTIDDVEEGRHQQHHQQQQQFQQIGAGDTNNGSEAAPAADPPKGPPGPPFSVPDGGLWAWLQVAGGFMLFFNTWGNLNTFGIFQTYYESGGLFQSTSSDIAWIGSLQSFMLLLTGFMSGPLYDRGYLRWLLIVGGFLVVFGYMMLSLCTTLWQCILAQGFCIGIGGGLLFVPSVAILPTYFRRRLGLAVGLAASGSSMGGVIFPIVFFKLIDRIGFGWTVRVIGFMCLATLILPIFVMRQRIKPPAARSLIDWTAFSDVPYLIFVGSTTLGFIGLYVILFYLSYFGAAQGITDYSLSFYLVPILNAASVFGRTVPNAVSDITGPLNMIGPGAFICGILVFAMLGVKTVGGIVTIAVLFGFFSGVFIALPPVCFAALTKDKSKIGTRIGMGFGTIGISVLLGGPATGGILGNSMPLNWTGAWIYGGVTLIAAGCLFFYLRMSQAGWKLKMKV